MIQPPIRKKHFWMPLLHSIMPLKHQEQRLEKRKKPTEKLALLFDEADKAIELMNYAIGIAKDDQVDFSNAYKINRKLVDTNTGIISLKAKAIDLLNGTPLKGVTFTFIPEGVKMNLSAWEMTKRTDKFVVSKLGYKVRLVFRTIVYGKQLLVYQIVREAI
jgi:hypothetical protein